MGIVLEARDPLIRRIVAIKTIHLETLGDQARETPEESPLREKVLREARAAGALSHPGIVVVYDVGHQDDFAYIGYCDHTDPMDFYLSLMVWQMGVDYRVLGRRMICYGNPYLQRGRCAV